MTRDERDCACYNFLAPMDHDQARILVIDDNPAIHDVFAKLLTPPRHDDDELASLEAELFGIDTAPRVPASVAFEVDNCYQGESGVKCVEQALAAGHPYALAFVDMRMPPGWDGLRTMDELWRYDPELEIVLCTAYADRDWQTILRSAARPERLLVLKKPFDGIEVLQMAQALSLKWLRRRSLERAVLELEQKLDQQSQELQRLHSEMAQNQVGQHQATP